MLIHFSQDYYKIYAYGCMIFFKVIDIVVL